MDLIGRILEWAFPAAREFRIAAEMAEGGEDAISAKDARWMEERNRKMRERGGAE